MHRLNYLGYNGELLSAKLNVGSITPKTSLRIENKIERIQTLLKVSTDGDKFCVTRGSNTTLDNMFKAAVIFNRKKI